jgi:diguanylate cyclase (GGDEF)-like protein
LEIMKESMEESVEKLPQFLRSDPLTGVGNALAFFEWLLEHSNRQPIPPFSLISLDVTGLALLNKNLGHAAGDAALRWAALVLLEETEAEVYRISGDEFVGVLTEGAQQEHTEYVERVSRRLCNEAEQVKLEAPAALVVMIHYTGLEDISPKDVLGVVYGAFLEQKTDPTGTFKVFDAGTTKAASDLSGLINNMVGRMVSLGSMLEKSQKLALTDSITGLPNMRAALMELESALDQADSKGDEFVILLIDGDDLSKYNKVGYMAGDEMIERLGTALQIELRPNDFLARWRTGDEFFVLLHKTSVDHALSVADRLREVVRDAAMEWLYPITISVGVAGYPDHAQDATGLIDHVERTLNRAKNSGKNQVAVET